MNVIAVESSAVTALWYDEARGILRLEFRSGAVYCYMGVPAAVHQDLMRAPSKGQYFNRLIRGRFPYALASHAQVRVAGKA
jgi:lysyl-tRNA synthetase, class II